MRHEHLTASYPARLREEVESGAVVRLDSDIAGHVSAWLDGGQRLRAGSASTLERLFAEADAVAPHLVTADERAYADRSHRLAALVIDAEE